MSSGLSKILAIATVALATSGEPKVHDHNNNTPAFFRENQITIKADQQIQSYAPRYEDWQDTTLSDMARNGFINVAKKTFYAPKEIHEAYKLKNSDNERLFDETNRGALFVYLLKGGNLDFIRELSEIKRADGSPVIHQDNAAILLEQLYLQKPVIGSEDICKAARITDVNGRPLFSNEQHLVTAAQQRISQEEASALNQRGFEQEHIVTAHKQGLDVTKYSKGQHAMDVILKDALGREDKYVVEDTRKPNGLYIAPRTDHNTAFQTEQAKSFLRELDQAYDLHIHTATSEQEAYEYIKEHENIELLVLAGHGSMISLTLDEHNSKETGRIDTGDYELVEVLSHVPSEATIFLQSCSNAYRLSKGYNLANMVHRYAPDKRLIAIDESFSISETKIVNSFPFQIEINSPKRQRVYELQAHKDMLPTMSPYMMLFETESDHNQ